MKLKFHIIILIIAILSSCKNDDAKKLSCENCNVVIENDFFKKNLNEILDIKKNQFIESKNFTISLRTNNAVKGDKQYVFRNGIPYRNQKIIAYTFIDSVHFYISDTISNFFKIEKPLSNELKIPREKFDLEDMNGTNYEPTHIIFFVKNNKIDTTQKMTMGY